MKNLIAIIALSCITLAATAQDKSGLLFMTKSLEGQSVKDVEVKTSGGSISVQNTSGEAQRIEVYIKSQNGKGDDLTKEEIERRLDQYYEMKVEVSGGKVIAMAKYKEKKWDRKHVLSISFKLFVPADVSTDLTTSGGSISLANLNGKQKFVTSGGNLMVNTLKGNIKGMTSGGSIQVKNSSDEIELTTSGGNIQAIDCRGKIKLVTSGGHIDMQNLDGKTEATTSGGNVAASLVTGELSAHTSGGNVSLQDISGNLTAGTSGGNVRVSIKSPGKYVTIKTSGGNIDLDLASNNGYDLDISGSKIKTSSLNNFNGSTTEHEMVGSINGGGAKVKVDGNGKVTINVK